MMRGADGTRPFDAVIALAGDIGDGKAIGAMARLAPLVIAADAGADRLAACGATWDYYIGDADSLADAALIRRVPALLFSSHKDQTDGELALALATMLLTGDDRAIEALFAYRALASSSDTADRLMREAEAAEATLCGRRLLWLCHGGGRMDHLLNTLMLAASASTKGAEVFLSDGVDLVRAVTGPCARGPLFPPELLALRRGGAPERTIVSVQSLTPTLEGLALSGLVWEAENLTLPRGSSLGLSNRPDNKKKTPPQFELRRGTGLLMWLGER